MSTPPPEKFIVFYLYKMGEGGYGFLWYVVDEMEEMIYFEAIYSSRFRFPSIIFI